MAIERRGRNAELYIGFDASKQNLADLVVIQEFLHKTIGTGQKTPSKSSVIRWALERGANDIRAKSNPKTEKES